MVKMETGISGITTGKAYYGLSEEEREVVDKKESEILFKERYYFWTYCKPYGWRCTGNLEGYDSVEHLKEHNKYTLGIYAKRHGSPYIWKILKTQQLKE